MSSENILKIDKKKLKKLNFKLVFLFSVLTSNNSIGYSYDKLSFTDISCFPKNDQTSIHKMFKNDDSSDFTTPGPKFIKNNMLYILNENNKKDTIFNIITEKGNMIPPDKYQEIFNLFYLILEKTSDKNFDKYVKFSKKGCDLNTLDDNLKKKSPSKDKYNYYYHFSYTENIRYIAVYQGSKRIGLLTDNEIDLKEKVDITLYINLIKKIDAKAAIEFLIDNECYIKHFTID